MGAGRRDKFELIFDHRAIPAKEEMRRSSRHNRAERRWDRLRASPRVARKAVNRTKVVSWAIKRIWVYTKIG